MKQIITAIGRFLIGDSSQFGVDTPQIENVPVGFPRLRPSVKEEARHLMRASHVVTCVAMALLFAACGGGGGGGNATLPVGTTLPPDPVDGTSEPEQQLVVVRYDFDGDDHPDVLTLDRNESPMEIVEALKGTATGEVVDVTSDWAGQTVDSAISDAVNSHLISTFSVGDKTDVYVTDTLGHDATVTIFD